MTIAPAEIEITLNPERIAALIQTAPTADGDAGAAAAGLGITE